jgi:hypothetical protein
VKPVIALLTMAAALTVGALAAPAAEANTRTPVVPRISTAHRLRVQLHTTRAKLARANAGLARTRHKLASSELKVQALNLQVSQLQGMLAQTAATLTQAKAELVASQAQAAALQAKFDAIPTPLAVAEEQVRREVAWAEYADKDTGTPFSDGQLVGLSAMNYVLGHVSVGAYGYLELFGGAQLPTSKPDSILGTQAGICGHAALTFAAIVQHFGYSVRSVQFFYTTPDGTPDSHIADEVYYDGRWHFLDPTFGVYWTDGNGNALAITDARASGGTEHKDDVSFTNLIEDPWYAGDDTAFETDPATTVVLDGQSF